MVKSELIGVSPQYEELLTATLQDMEHHWDKAQLNEALKEINSGGENGAFLGEKLLRIMAEGGFPFIILFQSPRKILFGKEIGTPSLVADPEMVEIVSNGKEVHNAIKARVQMNLGFVQGSRDTLRETYNSLRNLLIDPPDINYQDFKPKTVAIAKTIHPNGPYLASSLSLGNPYTQKLKEIEMGSLKSR